MQRSESRDGEKACFKPYGLNVSVESRFKAPLGAFLPRDGHLYRRGANGDSKAVLWRFGRILLRSDYGIPPSDRALSSPNRSTE